MASSLNILSIILDAITIGLYYGWTGSNSFNTLYVFIFYQMMITELTWLVTFSDVCLNEWHGINKTWSMVITNLLLRPITSLVLLRFYNERAGRYSALNIPGFGSFGSTGAARGSYEDLDGRIGTTVGGAPHQSVPSHHNQPFATPSGSESSLTPNYPPPNLISTAK